MCVCFFVFFCLVSAAVARFTVSCFARALQGGRACESLLLQAPTVPSLVLSALPRLRMLAEGTAARAGCEFTHRRRTSPFLFCSRTSL